MEYNKEVVDEELNNEEFDSEELTKEELIEEEDKEEIKEDPRNLKEKLYDRIQIPLKVLDFIIVISVTILVLLLIYFVVRKYF